MLPPATEKLWRFLEEQATLSGFVLIGGSALAMRIKHRLSEDLDFSFPEDQLPRARLDVLVRLAAQAGFAFRRTDDESAIQEFTLAGMGLYNFTIRKSVNRIQ